MAAQSFSGGAALEAKLREIAEKAGKPGTLRVGFLEGSTYPDGTPVPLVAALNNYGTESSPPRPFFTQMVEEKKHGWGSALGKIAVETGYDMSQTLGQMGEGIKDQLQGAIRDFSSPGLADSTIARKGFNKPLIDTSVMLNSAAYEVKDE
jgi:hypothetical protein